MKVSVSVEGEGVGGSYGSGKILNRASISRSRKEACREINERLQFHRI
jgi:hypothetical protein